MSASRFQHPGFSIQVSVSRFQYPDFRVRILESTSHGCMDVTCKLNFGLVVRICRRSRIWRSREQVSRPEKWLFSRQVFAFVFCLRQQRFACGIEFCTFQDQQCPPPGFVHSDERQFLQKLLQYNRGGVSTDSPATEQDIADACNIERRDCVKDFRAIAHSSQSYE